MAGSIDDLLAHLCDDPDDDEGWLVVGDALLSEGDARGELITLQARLARASLDDRPALLAARAPLVLAEPRLGSLFLPPVELAPFVGGSAPVVHYCLDEGEVHATIDGEYGALRVEVAGEPAIEIPDAPSRWSDAETTVFLGIFGEALRGGWGAGVVLPSGDELVHDLHYRPGPLPLRFGVSCRALHLHTWRCESEEAWPASRRALFDFAHDERLRRARSR